MDCIEKKEEQIMVSVIFTTYNQIDYIDKALSSIVSQKTNFKYEIFLHDDASTDGTEKIVRRYAEQYPDLIKPIFQTVNQYSKGKSIIASLIPLLAGKYWAFCEGDDYWCDNYKLQKQFDVMEKNEKCSICVHKTQNINEDGTIYPSVHGEYEGIEEGILETDLVCQLFLKRPRTIYHTSSYFIRISEFKDIYLSKPEFMKYSTGGDQVFLRICLNQGEYYFLDETMSCYRRFAKGSINANSKNKNIDFWYEYYMKYALCNMKFDEFSDYRFHRYIRGWIAINNLSFCKYDVKKTRELMIETDVHINDFAVTHCLKYYFKYIAIMRFSNLYTYIHKIKNKK